MHRATDVEPYCKTTVLVNNYGFVAQGRAIRSMPRFDSATFEAPAEGTYRGPPSPSYQGLCSPNCLLAVLSSVRQRPLGSVQGQPIKAPVTSYRCLSRASAAACSRLTPATSGSACRCASSHS